MEKEKILEMSRKENKNKDIASKDAEKKATYIAVEATSIFIGIIFLWQMLTGNGSNYGLISTVLMLNAIQQWSMYKITTTKKHMQLAIFWTIGTVLSTILMVADFYK